MIKLEIWPAFLNRSTFELKTNGTDWELFVIKDSNEFLHDRGAVWRAGNVNSLIAEKIIERANRVIDVDAKDERIGLDGVTTKLRLLRNNAELEKKFWCPEKGTNEYELMVLFFDLIGQEVDEEDCLDYIELLEQYYFDTTPIKEYEEDPFRLKVYGGLTSSDLDVLAGKVALLKERPEGILDMTNFFSTGSALNGCFLELKDADHIQILVNDRSFHYLTQMGFDESRLTLKTNNRGSK